MKNNRRDALRKIALAPALLTVPSLLSATANYQAGPTAKRVFELCPIRAVPIS